MSKWKRPAQIYSHTYPERDTTGQLITMSGSPDHQLIREDGVIPTLTALKGAATFLDKEPRYKTNGVEVTWREYMAKFKGFAPIMNDIADIESLDKVYGNSNSNNILSKCLNNIFIICSNLPNSPNKF